jgi:hypothetical protein
MLHFRIFSDDIYTQNPVDLQVPNKNVSFVIEIQDCFHEKAICQELIRSRIRPT